jgi:hypothetical protein
MELRSLDICRTLPFNKPLHSVPMSALFASLWLAPSEKENVEHMNVHFRCGPHLHNAKHGSFPLHHFLSELHILIPQKMGSGKASTHFGWIFTVTIINISTFYRDSIMATTDYCPRPKRNVTTRSSPFLLCLGC